MNDQSKMINQHQVKNGCYNRNDFSNCCYYDQMMNVKSKSQEIVTKNSYYMDQCNMMKNHSSQMSQMVSQQPPPQAPPQMVANQMMAQSYGQWTQPQPLAPPHSMAPPPSVVMNAMKFPNPMNPMYAPKPGPGRSGNNWKGKRKDLRRKDNLKMNMNMNNNMGMNMNMNMNMNVNNGGVNGMIGGGVGGGGGLYQPPALYELEQQNRLKARRFYHPKKKFNRMGPYAHAPRNTTSYIIRAKKSGGIASLVSPCPVTPAVLPTPVFSPSREALVDMAKEEWGVDGYGSMKGLIRLRSPGHDETVDDYDEEEEGGSSESDVEEHVEVERRLDHDLSRFEMIYPNSGVDYHNVLENRVDDQDTHIAQLEEENLLLKERLYLMERELGEMRRRMSSLERQNQVVEDINEEVVENVSENDSEGHRNITLLSHRNNEEVDFVPRDGAGETGAGRGNNDETVRDELKVSHGEAMESHENGPVCEGKNDGLVFVVAAADKGVEHEENLAKELSAKPVEQCDSVNGTIDDAVKGQPVGDVCMVENLTGEVNEDDLSAAVVNDGTGVILKKDEETMVFSVQAEDGCKAMDKEAAGDVCMGDMALTGEAVGDDKSDS